jgi:sugar lactone lactonase YvrE
LFGETETDIGDAAGSLGGPPVGCRRGRRWSWLLVFAPGAASFSRPWRWSTSSQRAIFTGNVLNAMSAYSVWKNFVGGLFAACLCLGCATERAQKPAAPAPTFFPPAPDEPRIQFLTSFSSDAEISRTSRFAEYVTGGREGPLKLIKPYGVAMHGGKVFVCDTVANAILVFDFARRRSHLFKPRAEGRLLMPINVTIDEDGTRYVADTGRNQVVIYGADDSYLGAIGVRDEMRPCDVAIHGQRLYVADLKGRAVRVYGKAQRKFLFTIPSDPKAEPGRLFSPVNLAVDPRGRLLVSDMGGFTVQVYDLEGKYLRTIGRQGAGAGAFARPKGIAVDREGRAYVVDAATQVIQIFDPEGRLLLYFGLPGASSQGELVLPAGLDIDYRNVGLFQKFAAPGYEIEYLILATSQFGPNKVNVYGFLKKK